MTKHWTADNNVLDPDIFPTQKGPPHGQFDAWREAGPVHWSPFRN